MRWILIMVILASITGLILSGEKEDKEQFKRLIDEFNNAVKNNDWASACGRARMLGELGTADSVFVLIQAALKYERDDLQDAIESGLCKAFDKQDGRKSILEVTRKGNDWRARLLAVRVLAQKRGDGVLEALVDGLKDKAPRVVIESAYALASIQDLRAVRPLIDLLAATEKEKGLVWVAARESLTAITRADFPTADKWRSYWDAKEKEIESAKTKGGDIKPLLGDIANPRTVLTEEIAKAPKFFGAEVLSRRIMFVIDVSSSMQAKDPEMEKTPEGELKPKGNIKIPDNAEKDEWGGIVSLPPERARIERVKRELAKCIKELPSSVRFNIIAFSDKVKLWSPKLVKAEDSAKSTAIGWVSSLKADGDTHTDDALKAAFNDPEVDTIYLLSDGQPFKAGTPVDVEPILEWVKSNNRFRKVIINTFGFENAKKTPNMDVKAMMQLLKGLADMTGGKFTDIYW